LEDRHLRVGASRAEQFDGPRRVAAQDASRPAALSSARTLRSVAEGGDRPFVGVEGGEGGTSPQRAAGQLTEPDPAEMAMRCRST
jgi:hypothetical protein